MEKKYVLKNPMQAIKAGIALVPEDRKKQGLVLGNSVSFNMTLSSLRFYMNGIAINEKKRKKSSAGVYRYAPVKGGIAGD